MSAAAQLTGRLLFWAEHARLPGPTGRPEGGAGLGAGPGWGGVWEAEGAAEPHTAGTGHGGAGGRGRTGSPAQDAGSGAPGCLRVTVCLRGVHAPTAHVGSARTGQRDGAGGVIMEAKRTGDGARRKPEDRGAAGQRGGGREAQGGWGRCARGPGPPPAARPEALRGRGRGGRGLPRSEGRGGGGRAR